MTRQEDSAALPAYDLKISSTPVKATARKMKTQWSIGAAEDLRKMMNIRWYPRLPDNELDILRDALEDPNYDPNSDTPYRGLWRWEDGRIATPEEVLRAHPETRLVEHMADEMRAEIDREIARELGAMIAYNPSIVDTKFNPAAAAEPPVDLIPLLNAIELSECPRWTKDAARRIIVQNLS